MPVGAAIGAAGALAGGVGSIVGATQGAGSSGTTSPAKAARQTMQGWQEQMPLSLALNQQYQPQFLGLGAQNLEQLMFGQPDSAGLLSLLERAQPQLQGLSDTSARAGRMSDLAAMNEFAPQYQTLFEQTSPEVAALRKSLYGSAMEGMNAGAGLTADQMRMATQGSRAGMAARGMSGSNLAIADEVARQIAMGEQLLRARQQFGLNALSGLSQTQPDYMATILGQQGQMGNALGLLTGQQGFAYQGNQYSPYNATAAGVSQTGASLASQQAMNQQNMLAGLGGGLLNLSGSLYKSYTPTTAYSPNVTTGGYGWNNNNDAWNSLFDYTS